MWIGRKLFSARNVSNAFLHNAGLSPKRGPQLAHLRGGTDGGILVDIKYISEGNGGDFRGKSNTALIR
jgi:hypothetical protein